MKPQSSPCADGNSGKVSLNLSTHAVKTCSFLSLSCALTHLASWLSEVSIGVLKKDVNLHDKTLKININIVFICPVPAWPWTCYKEKEAAS